MPRRKEKPGLLRFTQRLDYIDVNRIHPNPDNPREPIARKEVMDILESIRTIGGVLVPIVVYRKGRDYILLDGERRWRACKKLSKQDPKYSIIPANIIQKPLTDVQNLQTMFNIHQKRKEWSTSAKAEAIGKLRRLKGKLSVSQLTKITGLDSTSVSDALLLLKFPAKVRKRCLNGEMNEFYPILLGRNLRTLEKVFPSLFKEYSWRFIANRFLEKVDNGSIRRTRDFNKLAKIASLCIDYKSEQLFESLFREMMKVERFTPRDAEKEIQIELGHKLEEAFKISCHEFARSLRAYLGDRPDIANIPHETLEILTQIYQQLREALLQKKLT